ncbi:MAG: hypothetical protein IKT40_12540 [Bacilli bacterium]|nr:hypothetical protein [Bacilli bacterium]
MIKRIILTESQFNYLLEAASLEDIHNKYYNNIDNDIFMQIISADPTYDVNKPQKMGKYGKWLLNIYKNGKLKLEDLYKATEYLKYFVKYINRIENKDINQYHSLGDLYNVVKVFMESNDEMATSNSDEIRRIKEGADKVYEDSEWMIIIPRTQEASCYYGKGTQWCTAAEKSYNYFDYYNDQGPLYINIDKRTNEKYQFHFESDSFMDENDVAIEEPIIENIDIPTKAYQWYVKNVEQYEKLSQVKEWVLQREGAELYLANMVGEIGDEGEQYWKLCDNETREVIADHLLFNNDYDAYQLYGSDLEDNGYCAIKNAYGAYTIISYDYNNGIVSKVGDSYTYVDLIDDVDYDENKSIVELVRKDGVYSVVFSPYFNEIYRNESSNVFNAEIIASDIIKINKRNGFFDLASTYSENVLYNLQEIDGEIEIDDYNEYLFVADKDGNTLKIRIEDLEIMDDEDFE